MTNLHQSIQAECKRFFTPDNGAFKGFALSMIARELNEQGRRTGAERIITLFAGASSTCRIRLIRALGRNAIDGIDFTDPRSIILYVEDAIKAGGAQYTEGEKQYSPLMPADVQIVRNAYSALIEGIKKRENELRIGTLLATMEITEGNCTYTAEDASELYALLQVEPEIATGINGFINDPDIGNILEGGAVLEGDQLTPVLLKAPLDRYRKITVENPTSGMVER